MYSLVRRSIFPSSLLGVLTTVFLVWIAGCGASSSPEQVCNTISQMNFPGDSQIASLLASAGTKDCLLGIETDADKAAALKTQGQLDAIKGLLLMRVQTPPVTVSADALKAKILAASDVSTAFGFAMVLKLAGRFSDADISKLDATYTHLGIGEAFRNYSHPVK